MNIIYLPRRTINGDPPENYGCCGASVDAPICSSLTSITCRAFCSTLSRDEISSSHSRVCTTNTKKSNLINFEKNLDVYHQKH